MTEDEYWDVAGRIMGSVELALGNAGITWRYPCEDKPPADVQFLHCFHKPFFVTPKIDAAVLDDLETIRAIGEMHE